ncbi:MAG: DNA translocase FtsK [Gammaproteobacteria bacterium]
MKQATQTKSQRRPLAVQMGNRIREGLFIISITFAIFLIISFSSYHSSDPGWSSTGVGNNIANWGGRAGAFLADVFLSIFGCMSFVLPPLIVFAGWIGVRGKSEQREFNLIDLIFKCIGFALIIVSGCGLTGIYFKSFIVSLPSNFGGILGDMLRIGLTNVFNIAGSGLFLVTALLCGITLFTGLSWLGLVDAIGSYVTRLVSIIRVRRPKSVDPVKPARTPVEPVLEKAEITPKKMATSPVRVEPKLVVSEPLPKPTKAAAKKVESSVIVMPGTLPPLTLLNPPPPPEGKAFTNTTFEELSLLVEQRLLDFGVEVKVVAVHPGPIITRFELELAPGIKVSKISGLAKDIARSLSAISVRVVEVIPGKSVIGLELPNEHREVVGLRDILESQRYAQSKSPVSLALGKDIAGYPVIVDLAKMPHLLVAGTTGSGKSVSVNAMLLSMLFKATPEQLRLILIDPKMLELSIYEGIPHLLTPVITDMKDAANALRWCVGEMDRRYKLMSAMGVRNLAGYNAKITEAIKQGNPIPAPAWLTAEGEQPAHLEPAPMIVVVADELADMMMVVGKKVEELITRIAQKARAAGIHLILATQRPSVDVITGLIKANIPTRIAFQVSSRIDSRTILDQQGAEQLLGNGDMLYLPPGTGLPVRVHGAYVADEEVHRVVAAWQTYGKPVYLDEVTEGGSETAGGAEGGNNGELDPLYDEALKIVTETRRASISLVQRRLRIGYNRAATIMESLEAAGVVSSMDGNGTREVLAPPPVEV